MKQLIILGGKLHPYGGIETHIFHFCQSMAEKLPGLPLYLTSTNYAQESKEALRQKTIKLHEFDCSNGIKGKLEYVRCLHRIRSERGENKILYSHGISGFAYLASRALRPSLWIHHHHSDVQPDTKFSKLYSKVLESADLLIACTHEHTRLLDKNYNRGNRTIFLPYCKLEPKNVGIQIRSSRLGKIIIGFFGRLRESKGIRVLIELAPWFLAHGMECRLHGDDCEGWMLKGLPPGISWNGAYDSAKDIDRLLSAVDVVVLPTSFPEGLPIVMCEAISRGVPFVAYPGGGLREMASFHRGVIIVPPDVENLKAGLLQMKDRLGEPGLGNSLAKKYQQELGNQKTLDWWDNMLSGR